MGLRWWNHIDENGNSRWHFQSYEDQRYVHPTDSNVFWVTLFASPAMWVLLGIGAALTLRFMWLLLIVVALTLNSINLVGYIKCKRDAGKKLQALGGTMLTRGLQAWSRTGASAAPSSGGG